MRVESWVIKLFKSYIEAEFVCNYYMHAVWSQEDTTADCKIIYNCVIIQIKIKENWSDLNDNMWVTDIIEEKIYFSCWSFKYKFRTWY